MRFTLIDKITELVPGSSITAVKALSLAEEYLQDHFPRFPVMPGVLMLESMFQASAWLLRKSDEFTFSTVVLKEARNVKFADFVAPGRILTISAQLFKQDGNVATLKTQGTLDGVVAVSGRLIVDRFNLADVEPEKASIDRVMLSETRRLFDLLYQPNSSSKATASETAG